MIRITRGPEPSTLPQIRRAELTRVRAALQSGQALNATLLGDAYADTKPTLRAAQHYKCCYCEQLQPAKNRDVEHYRPKTRYWWLTWTWENLMFACDSCNRYEKNDLFPLRTGSRRLRAEETPPGPPGRRERPLLLDPANPSDSPMRHLRFRLIQSSGEAQWWATPRDGSQRGVETIRVLGLNRDDLLQARVIFYRTFYAVTIRALRRDLNIARAGSAQQRAGFRDRWTEVVGAYVSAQSIFAALHRDILDHHFPAAERDRYALALPDEL